ncbi:MAG: DNA polymerase III subunit delta [Chloroflexi bacterium HGW-Chloroflexi-6]|nr:MAG: DNA polymerase III subunit delta [Chloroflexi bacterium HGW-Chloroflexi-6]
MSDQHIYIFLGNDEFAIRKRVAKFDSIFSDPTSASMNTSLLDARTVSENELNNAVGAMPFLASKRLVVLDAPSKKYNGIEGHKKFIAFLETVAPSTLLALVDVDEIKEREIPNHWLVKWAAKNGDIAKSESFLLPKQREMPGWIANEAKRQGGQIEPQAAARLAEMVGEDPRQAAQEITKLLTYVNFAHAIGIEDVEAVSITSAGADVFDLVDAVGSQNGRQAQKLLRRLLDERDAFELFALVIRQFRLLLQAREVMEDGGNLPEVTSALGQHPFVAEKVFNQAKRFSLGSLQGIYRHLLIMDESAKTGVMTLDLSLETFIVELTHQK